MAGEQVPRRLGRYRLIRELGRGGFAVVYEARDESLGRSVALKILASHLAWDPGFVERFRREARATAGLRHPNIITIYEAGEQNGQLYIAMEYLEGLTLADLIREKGALSVPQAVAILSQVADALDHAHAHGLIHRDIKPSNIMVEHGDTDRPHVTLMDFGLVKAMEGSGGLTSRGTVLGTPEYMAPEQADAFRAGEVGPATDRYALGIVAYEMLTGRVPFTGSTPATLHSQIYDEPPDPRTIRSDIDPPTVPVLNKALSKSTSDRYPGARDMVEALRRAGKTQKQKTPAHPKASPQPKGPPTWVWGVVGVLALALIVGVIAVGRGKVARPTPTSTPIADTATSTPPAATPTPTMSVPAAPTSTPITAPTSTPESTPTPGPTPSQQAATIATVVSKGDGAVMVYVPEARFWIDRTEVTNRQYRQCVAEGGCTPPSQPGSSTRDIYYGNPEFDQYPVVYVDWGQADAYCTWAGKRLPTEEEWQLSACGAEGQAYPWGEWQEDHANTSETGIGDTARSGAYSPRGDSVYGCADIAGNVWEWTSSQTETGSQVLRGGSWDTPKSFAACTKRYWASPVTSNASFGFRCLSTQPPSEP